MAFGAGAEAGIPPGAVFFSFLRLGCSCNKFNMLRGYWTVNGKLGTEGVPD